MSKPKARGGPEQQVQRVPQVSKEARWFPHSFLTLALILTWVLLVGELSLGILLLGFVLSLLIVRMTATFWPGRPRIRSHGKVLAYVLLVAWDIIVANVQVAMIVLFRPVASLNSCWIVVPLELQSQEAIAVFVGTITLTPGTVSCDISRDGKFLLVHCLDAPDPEAVVHEVKSRYESRLKEIFQ